MKKIFLTLLMASLSGEFLWAGAWVVPPGGFYVEQELRSFAAEEDFDAFKSRQKKFDQGHFNEVTWKSYLEYGLKERWNLIAELPYKRSHFVDDFNDIDNAGYQDLSLGAKWLWRKKPVVVSFALTTTWPFFYDGQEPLGLGDERFDLEGRVFVSRAFFPKKIGFGRPTYSRLISNFELAKDRKGLSYLLDSSYLFTSWSFVKLSLIGQNDWPTQPDGEDLRKWNISLGFTSKGSNAIMRTDKRKSLGLTVSYGRLLSGRNTGNGEEFAVGIAFVF